MFEIKIVQSSTGKYDFMSNDEQFMFKIAIYQEGKIYQEGMTKAIAHFQGEPDDQYYFEDPIANLADTIEKCLEWSGRIISSKNYLAECLLFTKMYSEHQVEIKNNYEQKLVDAINKEIDKLKKDLERMPGIPDIAYEVNKYLQSKIDTRKVWKDNAMQKQLQCHKSSELYEEYQTKIDKYQKDINGFESGKIKKPKEV